MTGYEDCAGYWWLLPLIMFALCFFLVQGRCACACGFGLRKDEQVTAIEEEKNHGQ